MRSYQFELVGRTPLLVHADDIEGADRLTEWRKDPANKNFSKPGDDRSPPWTWATYLYTDGILLVIPSDNLMVALRSAGAQFILKKQKTFKSLTQTGLFIPEDMPLLVGGNQIKNADIEAITKLDTFVQQAEAAKKLGFSLFMKRAKVSTSKHIRVRARIEDWSLKGVVRVIKDEITEDILSNIFKIAGEDYGLCDWRPGSPKSPGPFGTFETRLNLMKESKAA